MSDIQDGIFHEETAVSEPFRAEFAAGLDKLVGILREDATARRHAFVTPETMASQREWYRAEYARMLGIDRFVALFGRGACETAESLAGEDALCRYTNVMFRIADEVPFYGLLLEPRADRSAPLPLAIFNHGGGGTPQLATDVWTPNHYDGKARALVERGFAVFAPQMMKWPTAVKSEGFVNCTTPNNEGRIDTALRQCGVSIVGWYVYCLSRVLDTLLARDGFDGAHVGMAGLSYGGFYTLYTMAYETRIRCGWSAAVFNDRMRYSWSDMVWPDSGARFLDEEVAGLCAPRKLWIDVGKNDGVFDNSALAPHFARAHEFFDAAGAGAELVTNLHPGAHRFSEGEAADWFARGVTE